MSIFSFLTSGAKTVDDVFDKDTGLLAFIDRQQFTDEEKAEMSLTQMDGIRKFVTDTLSESTERSQARRSIAVFFIRFYAGMLFLCGATYPVDPNWSEVWFKLATSGSVGGLVIAISIFFFGSHAIARHNDSKKG